MAWKPHTIDVSVISDTPRRWYDHFLANDEPNCEMTIFDIEPDQDSTFRQIGYGFCWRDWVENKEDVSRYGSYNRFTTIKKDDRLRIEYLDWGRTEGTMLSCIRGHTEDRGPALYPGHDKAVEMWSIDNLTQGWKIDTK